MTTDFDATRRAFDLPEGVIYLDGNSLGPLPRGVAERLARTVADEWGRMLITGWNRAGWIGLPARVGDRIARLVGAEPGSVVMGDTLSIKVYQALASALEMNPGRRVILSDTGNFPSDLYIAEGLARTLGPDVHVKLAEPEDLAAALDETVAVLLVTEVDYRTGRRHDMGPLIARAHDLGILTVWDLAHSAGAFPVHLAACNADFAVGCTYKYLNGGPGAPAFIYVAPRHQDRARPALSGWMGHEAPFAFDLDYRPAPGVERMRVGTPPILHLAALDAALDVWDGVDMDDLRARSLELGDLFIRLVEADCPDLTLATPRDPALRGSQVSFRHPQGYAIMQALIAQGVIGDFRAPDILRFGFTPLYVGPDDVRQAAAILARVTRNQLWDRPEFRKPAGRVVT
ncbi:kynureninase [Paracoccus shandongensis]|uniref:kynureninase n=1 Tax=Paracoccus shandongensis TaxID=2816048 RepID=UPI001A8DC3A0|nr:kynureninase [Paracoccus shandongensis]